MRNALSLLSVITLLLSLTTLAKGDHIVINGKSVQIISGTPFSTYPGIANLREQLHDYSTQCTEDDCQFLSEWQIIDQQLFLTSIHNCECNDKKQTANLSRLFNGKLKNGMLKADWFSGKIWLSNERPITWFCMVCPIWSRETCVTVLKGKVISIKEYIYPPHPRDPIGGHREVDSLTKLVVKKINWKRLKNLTDNTVTIRFTFTIDSLGRASKATTQKANYQQPIVIDNTWRIAAERAIKMYRWPVYYLHGEIYQKWWSIVINFNKAQISKN